MREENGSGVQNKKTVETNSLQSKNAFCMWKVGYLDEFESEPFARIHNEKLKGIILTWMWNFRERDMVKVFKSLLQMSMS